MCLFENYSTAVLALVQLTLVLNTEKFVDYKFFLFIHNILVEFMYSNGVSNFNRKLLVKKKVVTFPGTTRKITSLQVETLKLFRSNERSIGGTSRKVRFVKNGLDDLACCFPGPSGT